MARGLPAQPPCAVVTTLVSFSTEPCFGSTSGRQWDISEAVHDEHKDESSTYAFKVAALFFQTCRFTDPSSTPAQSLSWFPFRPVTANRVILILNCPHLCVL